MWSYSLLANPNLDHTGFYLLAALVGVIFTVGLIGMGWKEFKIFRLLWSFLCIVLVAGYFISYSDWDVPENKPYKAKFIGFVAERETHTGIGKQANQVSYSSHVYCEYQLEINNTRILMPCSSKQSPEYVILYWNNR